jgi:putative ABC transport system permease protein
LPNVETAALTSQVPFSGVTFDISGVQRAGQANTEESVTAWQYVVSDGYFDTLRLPLLRGREFTAAEAAAGGEPRVGIIDETLALQLFDDRDAVGRQIQFPSQDGPPRVIEIVGVAPGTRQGLGQTSSHVYLPSSQPYRTNVYVHLRIDERVADPRTLLESIRNEIQRIDPALPVLDLTTLRDFVAEEFEIWVVRTAGRLFTWLGAAAVFMAFVGVYGVTMFLTSRRTREIGVRMALGATRERIMRQIVREGLGVTFAGVALGLVLAIAVARLLSSMLYEVSAIDPVVFIGATALLVVAATLASYLPVRRASRVHPTTALRYE